MFVKTSFLFLVLFLTGIFTANVSIAQYGVGSTLQEYQRDKTREKVDLELRESGSRPPRLDAAPIREFTRRARSLYIRKVQYQRDEYAAKQIDLAQFEGLEEKYINKYIKLKKMTLFLDKIIEKIGNKNIRAYIPEQKFARGIMYINIVENI